MLSIELDIGLYLSTWEGWYSLSLQELIIGEYPIAEETLGWMKYHEPTVDPVS